MKFFGKTPLNCPQLDTLPRVFMQCFLKSQRLFIRSICTFIVLLYQVEIRVRISRRVNKPEGEIKGRPIITFRPLPKNYDAKIITYVFNIELNEVKKYFWYLRRRVSREKKKTASRTQEAAQNVPSAIFFFGTRYHR